MKWQKARILFDDGMPHLESLFLWVKNDHPEMKLDAATPWGLPRLFVLTNLEPYAIDAEHVGLYPDQVERYPEFADTVRIVKRKTWTSRAWKGARPPKGFRKEDESSSQRPLIGISRSKFLRSITDVVRFVGQPKT